MRSARTAARCSRCPRATRSRIARGTSSPRWDSRARTTCIRSRWLSRKLHPDRFARATPQERRFSLEQTTLLNDAYRTLKDPVRRAEHLLELRGVRMGEGSKVELPPEFLERALEDRERLVEAKIEGGPGAVEVLAREVQGRRDATLSRIAQQLRALENGSQADLAPVTQLISQLRYYARYLDEVEGRPTEP
jgi:molecular chaperone HscB